MTTSISQRRLTKRPALSGMILPALVAGAIMLCANVQAVSVIDFDGIANDYGVTKADAMVLPTTVHPTGSKDYIYTYNAASSISPTQVYTGPVFYGGGWLTSADGSVEGLSPTRVRADYTNKDPIPTHYLSQIEMGISNNHDGIVASGASFVAFGTPSGNNFSIDSTSSLKLNISTGSQSTVRFAILSGSQWYLSSESVSPTANLSSSLNLSGSDLLNSTWALWDPTGGADGRLGDVPADFNISGSDLGNIGAVGYYTSYNSTASNQYAYIGQFSADLASVPEPSTVALTLLSLCGLAGGVMRRR
jgi:PEP-CTERM motif